MFLAEYVSYQSTQAFTRIVLDYVEEKDELRSFYNLKPSSDLIHKAVEAKKKTKQERDLLVEVLWSQYGNLAVTPQVKENINALKNEHTFTVCTAHQPNLFTGPLYFIYKILHTIRLAEQLRIDYPELNFVPVYYMGSEDADFAELNHTYVDGKKIEWKKEQSGAVGRMQVDATLIALIQELEGQLSVAPFGTEIISILKETYREGVLIQQATFELVNRLYGKYGLVVLIPDHPLLKKQMARIFDEDLFLHIPSKIVSETSRKIEVHYSAQAYPRDINLFYLKDQVRERIIREQGGFSIHNTDMTFTEDEMRKELAEHPERFSPNVILRGMFQEMILPNLIFVGGGGELAYWLQLKDLFNHYGIPFPMLVLRNSFLVIEKKWLQLLHKLEITSADIFLPEHELMEKIVKKYSDNKVTLNGHLEQSEFFYNELKTQAGIIDPTLERHVDALKTKAIQKLENLEKKMIRAEKRKFSVQQHQIANLKSALFPMKGLQERKENISGFYAKWGSAFIDELYQNSLSFDQKFCILKETE